MQEKTTDISMISQNDVENLIYTIRGQKVMLDVDLARIYGYETKAFNQQVKRNIERFPIDMMFQLNDDEVKEFSRSQFVTLKKSTGRGKNIKYNPYAFTEQGIYMLMTVLKGELAIRQSIMLVRIFKEMKDYVILNGQTVEADLAYSEIYAKARKAIYVVDNYIGLKTLSLLKAAKQGVAVVIFSDNIGNILRRTDYNDFITQYKSPQISFKKTNGKFHDRYIILDYKSRSEKIYHCGASSKDAGKKITSITLVDDHEIYHSMVEDLLKNPVLALN